LHLVYSFLRSVTLFVPVYLQRLLHIQILLAVEREDHRLRKWWEGQLSTTSFETMESGI